MHEQLKLSEAEWGVIVDLLENERGELPVEIHHSRNSSVRDQLRQRLEMVERLLERLRTPAAV
jgi:aromatic ring-cleaving dioxygenase